MLTRRQIPNVLTWLRVLAVPVALAIILAAPEWHLTLLLIFVVASLTDFFDGYLARKWGVVSPIGTLLDPIADKLLVTLLLVYLVTADGQQFGMDTTPTLFDIFLPAVLIILRELYISGLREFLAARGVTLPVSKGGKLKTALQMVGITLLLATPVFAGYNYSIYGWSLWNTGWLPVAGCWSLWLAALAALVSALQYTRASWNHLR